MKNAIRFKGFALAFLCLITALGFPVTANAAEKPKPSTGAFVLYCMENGKIILSKNQNKRMKPASTTKLMTTLLTLEEAAKNDRVITFTDKMVAEGSSMYLEVGEKVRLSDLAAGMMMSSGNDAANAAALSIAGSDKKFANLMNARSKQIGMEHTHFVTASGLDDSNHYSTAYDMALLMREGLKNEAFAALTFQKSATVSFVEPADKKVTYPNHNRLLSLYDDCIGGKTGYTMAAGRCLVSAARRNGVTLICVTLDDKNDWKDHAALYDYGFSKLSGFHSADSSLCIELPCVGSEKDSVGVMGDGDVSLVVPCGKADKIKKIIYLDSFVYAPVKEGEKLGKIDYVLDGKVLHSTKLTAIESADRQKVKKSIFQRIKELFTYG